MSMIAERAYNSTRTNKTNKSESAEDKAYRLAQKYNSILRLIEQVNDARSFLQVRNEIGAYAHEAGKNSMDVMKLTGKLNERIKVVTNETQASIDRLSSEIDEIKNEKFEESVEVLQKLNTQAEHKMLEIMMHLGTNNDGGTGNKRRIGNYVVNADRPTALALMKLASLPQYMNCFTTKQKEVIVEKSKSPAEVAWERNKEPMLAEKSSQLGKEYLKAMNIRNVQKQITNTENKYYFKESEV